MKYRLWVLLIAFGQNVFAQDEDHTEHDHGHHNEIGIANAPVYFIKEKEVAYGLHFHYLHTINHSQFGIGLGYEQIFDEHQHRIIGLIGSYRPVDKLSINISPGVTFEGEDTSHMNFVLHLEATYEVEFHDFHLGPVFGFSYDPEDYHISLGVHVGYGF